MIKTWIQHIGIALIGLATFLVLAVLVLIWIALGMEGIPVISWEFLSAAPRNGMIAGGIFPAIFGTTLATLVSTLVATPIGIGSAIYLQEYAPVHWITRAIRASIRNLAGIPSIVYGLFGLTIFVQFMGMGLSVLAAGCTLGLLTLPSIIATSEEALRNVPRIMREGALALGATRWETVKTVVLPAAIPGVLTGVILALSRAAGETAPILFTGVAFYTRYIPGSLLDEFMALPYHLYILSTQHHAIETVRPLAFATALTLLALVFVLNFMAIRIRSKYDQGKK
ncbi:MAG TPA: phosphate ABC transporter permease PtsA [Saprospirales bacterium]|nr:phosphate ABC transporter permease PtsA [Saprospirales bacterium]